MLVYCSYPLLDTVGEPEWVGTLIYAKQQGSLEGITLYRPLLTLAGQDYLEAKLDRKGDDVLSVINMLHLQDTYLPESVADVELLETPKGDSLKVVTKELWVLSKADVLVVDCGNPSHGEKDMLLMAARLMHIPVIGVGNSFINNPWLVQMTNYRCSSGDLPNLLNMIQRT